MGWDHFSADFLKIELRSIFKKSAENCLRGQSPNSCATSPSWKIEVKVQSELLLCYLTIMENPQSSALWIFQLRLTLWIFLLSLRHLSHCKCMCTNSRRKLPARSKSNPGFYSSATSPADWLMEKTQFQHLATHFRGQSPFS